MRTLLACLCLLALAAACGDDNTAADAAPRPDAVDPHGRFTMSWTISDGNAPLACGDVGARSIAVTAFPRGAAFADTDALSCEGGSGTTHLLEAGAYNVTLELVAFEGSLADPVRDNDVVINPGQDTDLGTVEFVVVPRGGFRFRVGVNGATGNCDPVDAGGAGIDELEIALADGAGNCIPTDFDVGGSDTYASNCTGARHACIDAGVNIQSGDLPAGPLTVQITAYRAGQACYTGGAPADIPGGNLVSDTGTVHLALDAACSAT